MLQCVKATASRSIEGYSAELCVSVCVCVCVKVTNKPPFTAEKAVNGAPQGV